MAVKEGGEELCDVFPELFNRGAMPKCMYVCVWVVLCAVGTDV